ncbi:MAG: sugar transferase [Bifidobacteriaceae bacterium]|nr:sugar transferase [Bifidobacteriaceae bacterium]
MTLFEAAALVDTPWFAAAFGGSFGGDSQPAGRPLLVDPLVLVWAGGTVALALASIAALLAVRGADVRETAQVETTQVNATGWRRVYRRRLVLTDLVVVLWAMLGSQVLWLGSGVSELGLLSGNSVAYGWVGLAIAAGWVVSLQLAGARDPGVYGEGVTEYGRVALGTFAWFGALAILALLVKADFARGYVLISLPVGMLGLLWSRWVWRNWLATKRRQGLYSVRCVVAGDADAVKVVVKELSRQGASGYRVEGIALDDTADQELLALGVPIARVDEAVGLMRLTMCDSIIVAGGRDLESDRLRSLSWELEPTENLILTPMLLDVAGPRVATRPVAGLNLMHVDVPRFTGPKAGVKRVLDLTASGVGLLVLAIPFAVIALAIKLTSKGPVFYRHERIGWRGQPLKVWKFRSMVVDADQLEVELHAKQDAGNEVLFKMTDDPRVTKVGRWMRRRSVDELPQLINVLVGNMSLVGPRPHVQAELDQYPKQQLARRLMVKPGITGLWQVSGRSDLSFDESIRLDLYYVENWSIIGDLQLLFRTIKVVLKAEGAY